MTMTSMKSLCAATLVGLLASGCAVSKAPAYDYSAFRASNPKSILVLPPTNSTVDVKAGVGFLSQVTHPLAEAGYYVLPVTLMSEAFQENGLSNAHDIHAVAPTKLREIFGADAALYIDITEYGTKYQVIQSVTTVSAKAKLVDLRNGASLWEGKATASSAENQNNQNQGGLAGMLVGAIVNQIVKTVSDEGHKIAGITSQRLLAGGQRNGLLYGPRSPNYGKEVKPQ